MVTSLKHRLALALLVGVFVIPVLASNNGGLTHLLFCSADVAQPFALKAATEETEDPTVTSSVTVDRETLETASFEGEESVTEVCEGVRAEISASPLSQERVLLTVSIVNDSELPWRGSIGLLATGESRRADLTAAIGEVGPGERGEATMELRVAPGQTDIGGTILLGP